MGADHNPDKDPKAEKSPVEHALEQALDLFVYAPVGAALTARDELPALIAKGRERVTGQLTLAKMFGQFAVTQGQREAQKVAERLRQQAVERASRLAGAASTPSPSHRPPPPAGASQATSPGNASNGSQTAGAATAAQTAATAAQTPAAATPAAATPAATPANGSAPRPAVAPPPVGELAIPGYDNLSASQVVQRLAGLSTPELEAVRRYESATRGRRTILAKVTQLQSAPPAGSSGR